MYDDIIGLKDPIICQRGVFFGVAPPIYTRVCIYPLVPVRRASSQTRPYISPREGKDKSLGTFPIAASVHLRSVSSETRPFNSPRRCRGEACNPTRSLTEDLFARTSNPSITMSIPKGRRHFPAWAGGEGDGPFAVTPQGIDLVAALGTRCLCI